MHWCKSLLDPKLEGTSEPGGFGVEDGIKGPLRRTADQL